MVALGDSYTAGGMMPLDPLASPPGCLRSTKAYPVLVAQALGAPLTDVACASAGVTNMTAPQKTYLGTNPAQLSALAPDDRLVVLTLSGDDVGFLNVFQECLKLSLTQPSGSPCEAHYTQGGTDQLAASVTAVGPKVATVLAAIAARAPKARIVVVGYPDVFPQSGGCWPAVPITDGDIAYLRGIEVKINAMLAAEAQARGRHVREHVHAHDRARLLPAGVGQGCRGVGARLPNAPLPPQRQGSASNGFCCPSGPAVLAAAVVAARAGGALASCGTVRRAAAAAGSPCSPPRPAPVR